MFIRIEDNIININEIRNVELLNFGNGKGILRINFRSGVDHVSFSKRNLSELNAIMDTLADACMNIK